MMEMTGAWAFITDLPLYSKWDEPPCEVPYAPGCSTTGTIGSISTKVKEDVLLIENAFVRTGCHFT